jgi:predicted PurR-regulated permease PerM
MRRPFRWDKKYLYWGITAFLVIAAAILFYMALNYLPLLGSGLSALLHILSPFIWGMVICYLLSPFMRAVENRIFLPLSKKLYKNNKKNDGRSFARGMSVLVSIIFLLAILTALISLIIPQLYSSIQTLVVNSPSYITGFTNWVEKVLEDYPEIEQSVTQTFGDMNTSLMEWLQNKVLPGLGSIISNVTSGVYYVVLGIYNLVIGIIVSIYVLNNLEHVAASSKRLLYSIFSVDMSKKLLDYLDFVDRTFMGFITGKLLDSAIVGLICYIFCAIVGMPYALLVSVIVGVTNIIPFFGPFIGAVPSAFIILMVSPIKCLVFVIFVIVLQQVDGNIIGPKILGSTVGINGFWVMFSIILGAGLFGFWGMLLGVPVFVVIYAAINGHVERKLKRSDLPWETAEYEDIDYIDPITYKPIMKQQEEEEE